jgi:hypothetical protein
MIQNPSTKDILLVRCDAPDCGGERVRCRLLATIMETGGNRVRELVVGRISKFWARRQPDRRDVSSFWPIRLPTFRTRTGFCFSLYMEAFIGHWILRSKRPELILIETHVAWPFVRRFMKAPERVTPLVVDLHGAYPEEVDEGFPETKWKKCFVSILNELEQEMLTAATLVVVQSRGMEAHLLGKWSTLKLDAKIIVVPSAGPHSSVKISEDCRRLWRTRLKLSDEAIAVAYVGGLHSWQCIAELVLFIKSGRRMGKPFELLFASYEEPEQVRETLAALGADPVWTHVTSVPPDRVAEFLSSADVAWLYRRENITNAVASPTKLQDYRRSGLPIITGSVSRNWLTQEDLANVVILSSGESEALEIAVEQALVLISKTRSLDPVQRSTAASERASRELEFEKNAVEVLSKRVQAI